jgi:hypothetical protein
MSGEKIEIPVTAGNIFSEDPTRPVEGGHSRLVPAIPIGDGRVAPCLWKSHYTIQIEGPDGSKTTANECLLLIARNPLLTIRAEVASDAWPHFGRVTIEW